MVCMYAWYGMSSRRIFVPKLIFLLFWVGLGPGYPKIAGYKFSHPFTPLWGAFWSMHAIQTNPAFIFADNDAIFMILRLSEGFWMKPILFMIFQKRSEIHLQHYGGNFYFIVVRKVKIQCHYQVGENLVMWHLLSEVFKHGKTFGSVGLVLRHSCYEITNWSDDISVV